MIGALTWGRSQSTGLDEQAFTALYAEERDRVWRYASTMVGPGQAEDVVAEAFARAWRSRARYDASRASGRTWTLGIARNVAFEHLRARTRVADAPDHEPVASAVDADAWIDLRAAMAALPAGDREIIGLRLVLGLSTEDVAVVLGIKPSAVTSRLSRARTRLEQIL